jgi:hypothetical protein
MPRRAGAKAPPLLTDPPEPETDPDDRITSAKRYAEEIWAIAKAGRDDERPDVWLKATMHLGDLHGWGPGCLAPKAEESVDEDDLADDPKALLEQMKAAVEALEKKVGRGGG